MNIAFFSFYVVDAQVDNVRSDMQRLNRMFVALKDAIRSELENPTDGSKPVSVSAAVDNIMNSPTADWEQHEKNILNENRDNLRDSKDIQRVLDCLGLEWDYLNPDIYENLICDFSLHSLDEQLDEYKAELWKFMDKTPIKVFSAAVGNKKPYKMIPEGFTKQFTKHKWKSPVFLKDVEEFRRKVASNHGLRRCAVFLVELGIKSPVTIGLLMPITTESLINSTEPEFFMKHNIMRMTFNGSVVTPEVSKAAKSASITVCYAVHIILWYTLCLVFRDYTCRKRI